MAHVKSIIMAHVKSIIMAHVKSIIMAHRVQIHQRTALAAEQAVQCRDGQHQHRQDRAGVQAVHRVCDHLGGV